MTDKHHIPLIINDRMDIALAVKAAGVHIGQRDIPVAAARKVIGKNMLLGVSASSLREAVRALKDGADEAEVTAPTAHVRENNYAYVKKEFKKLRSASKHKSLRINLECTLLTREEIMRTCTIAADCRD